MHSFIIINPTKAQFIIDEKLYSKSVITKVLYWLSSDFTISSCADKDNVSVEIEATTNSMVEWNAIKRSISTMLNDYRMRELIETETHDIRNILYIKAFSNLDQFDEDFEE
jgi:His-Xaa-Ser system protein HxsD